MVKQTNVSRRGGRAPTRYRVGASALAMALAIAACGGGEGDGGATDEPVEEADDGEPGGGEGADGLGAGGLQYFSDRDELIAASQEEPRVDMSWALAPDPELDVYLADFAETYPWIELGEFLVHDTFEARQRWLLEADAGAVRDQGIMLAAQESFAETEAFCDWDIYGMAEAGVLDVPLDMIDPNTRTTVSAGNSPGIFFYNLEAFEDRPLPETWDDVLDPEVYGSDHFNLLGDTRFFHMATMVEAWGLDRTTEYVEQFAALDPIWTNRIGPAVEQVELGEYDAFAFATLQSVYNRMVGAPDLAGEIPRQIEGDHAGILFLEPVPVRMTDTHCVLNEEMNPAPATSILFLEWLTSDEGQAAYHDPDGMTVFENSVFGDIPGSNSELLDHFELSVVSWEQYPRQAEYINALLGAAGFPQPIGD